MPTFWITIRGDSISPQSVVFLRSISAVRLREFALEIEFCRPTSRRGHMSKNALRESGLNEYPFRLGEESRLDSEPISRQPRHKDDSPHPPSASAFENVFPEGMAATKEHSSNGVTRASAIRMPTSLTRSKSTSIDWCTRMREAQASSKKVRFPVTRSASTPQRTENAPAVLSGIGDQRSHRNQCAP